MQNNEIQEGKNDYIRQSIMLVHQGIIRSSSKKLGIHIAMNRITSAKLHNCINFKSAVGLLGDLLGREQVFPGLLLFF